MSKTRFYLPKSEEVTFKEAGIDPRGMITRTDKFGRITFASKAFRKMSQFSKEELIGKSHSVVRHPLMPRIIFQEMWKMLREGKPWRGPIINRRKDGKFYWVDVEISPIDKNGNITDDKDKIEGYIAIRKELSEIDKQKALEKYLKLKEEEYSTIFKTAKR